MGKNTFTGFYRTGALPDPHTVNRQGIVDEIWQDYVDSATTLLPELEASAMHLESGHEVEANAANIKRILHCIKGESGMVGLMDVHDLCHEVESAFEKFQDNLNQAADMVLKAKDWMNSAIDFIENKGEIPEADPVPESVPSTSEVLPGSQKSAYLKALVVDDAVVCRKRINMLLRNFFEITFAANGREGLELYRKSVENGEPFSLITMDINMPELDGHEALDAIRRYEGEKGINGLDGVKIIMTTSQGGSGHVMKAFRQGCEAYVVKADMGEKLLDEIAKLGLMRARHYMQSDPVMVWKDTPIFEAIKLLAENPESAIPVVDHDLGLCGIFSERDVLVYLNSAGDGQSAIEGIMTREVTGFDQETSLIDICRALTENHYRSVPITDHGSLVGVITRKQIIRHILALRNQDQ